LGYRDPSVLALITPTLLTILYLSSAIYIFFQLTLPFISTTILFIPLF